MNKRGNWRKGELQMDWRGEPVTVEYVNERMGSLRCAREFYCNINLNKLHADSNISCHKMVSVIVI